MRRVFVFGVFDGIHEGHKRFLKEAKLCGDYLIASIAPDGNVEKLKGHKPEMQALDRINKLIDETAVDEAVLGDAKLGSWNSLKRFKPEVIALGYDQTGLKTRLEECIKDFDWKPEIKVMSPFEPEKCHSRVIANNANKEQNNANTEN